MRKKRRNHRMPRPPGYWTKERILAEAKKHKFKSDFKRLSPGAYLRASRIGIFEKATAHMQPQTIRWTPESAIKEARKYQYRSDFQKASPGGYACVLRMRLMPRLESHFKKKRGDNHWSVEKISRIARRFKTRSDFHRLESAAYNQARRLKILDEVCSHIKRTSALPGYWTKEKVLEESKKFESRTAFIRGAPGAYRAAVRLEILSEAYAHMRRVGSKYQRAIYAFEFPDRSVYVGLTYDYDRRYAEHLSKTKILISKIAKMDHKFVRFDKWYSNDEAALKEAIKIEEYRLAGWTILNTAKPGGLGKDKVWTAGLVRSRAKKFKSLYDFRTKDRKAYSAAFRLGILSQISKHLEPRIKRVGFWKPGTIRAEALRYRTRTQFRKGCHSAYEAARRLGILDRVCRHMAHVQVPSGYWTEERIKKIARRYKNYAKFLRSEPAAVSAARKRGILERVSKDLKRSRTAPGFWTQDRIRNEALRYLHRGDFFNNSTAAYNAARNLKILDAVCAHMSPKIREHGKIKVRDLVFPSIAAAAAHHGINRAKVSSRLRSGWEIEEALELKPRKRPVTGYSLSFRGKRFDSRSALCRNYGIPAKIVENRIKIGWSLAQSLELSPRNTKGGPRKITIGKIEYKSVAAACRAFGLEAATVIFRLHGGWSIEQAFNIVPPPERRVNGTKIHVSGRTFRSIGEAARAFGLNPTVVRSRLAADWTIQEALNLKIRPRSLEGRRVTFQGKTYPDLAKMARAFKRDPKVVSQRVKPYGWTIEEALDLKLRKRKRR